MEGAMIAEAIEVKLQRLRFHEPAARHVIDHERGEIRLTSNRRERGKFRKSEARDIIAVQMRIGHPIEHSLVWRCGYGHRAAELGRCFHCEPYLLPSAPTGHHRRSQHR